MTTFTMRYVNGHLVVTGPDISLMRFKSRAEAMDWRKARYPGSPINEIDTRRSGPPFNELTASLSPDDRLRRLAGRRRPAGGSGRVSRWWKDFGLCRLPGNADHSPHVISDTAPEP